VRVQFLLWRIQKQHRAISLCSIQYVIYRYRHCLRRLRWASCTDRSDIDGRMHTGPDDSARTQQTNAKRRTTRRDDRAKSSQESEQDLTGSSPDIRTTARPFARVERRLTRSRAPPSSTSPRRDQISIATTPRAPLRWRSPTMSPTPHAGDRRDQQLGYFTCLAMGTRVGKPLHSGRLMYIGPMCHMPQRTDSETYGRPHPTTPPLTLTLTLVSTYIGYSEVKRLYTYFGIPVFVPCTDKRMYIRMTAISAVTVTSQGGIYLYIYRRRVRRLDECFVAVWMYDTDDLWVSVIEFGLMCLRMTPNDIRQQRRRSAPLYDNKTTVCVRR